MMKEDSESVLRLLLQYGADPNARTLHYNQTPLEVASEPVRYRESIEIVLLLKTYGAREPE